MIFVCSSLSQFLCLSSFTHFCPFLLYFVFFLCPVWSVISTFSPEPRSRNECVRLCIIMTSLEKFKCLNSRALITPCWISYAEAIMGEQSKNRTLFCRESRIQSFIKYLTLRRNCFVQCPRDCIEEIFNIAMEMTPFDGDIDPKLMSTLGSVANQKKFSSMYANAANTTVITIRSNRKAIENVQHHVELTLIELVGVIGGLMHLWVGVSFISLYDILSRLLYRTQLFFRSNVIVS